MVFTGEEDVSDSSKVDVKGNIIFQLRQLLQEHT